MRARMDMITVHTFSIDLYSNSAYLIKKQLFHQQFNRCSHESARTGDMSFRPCIIRSLNSIAKTPVHNLNSRNKHPPIPRCSRLVLVYRLGTGLHLVIINKVILPFTLVDTMTKWHYVQDVMKEKADAFCKNSMKLNTKLIYAVATARSNNPGMVAVYYREKQPES